MTTESMTTKRLTTEDLAVIEARANAATGGEWASEADNTDPNDPCSMVVLRERRGVCVAPFLTLRDSLFIAAARTDVPALVAEVRALTAERVELRFIFDALPRCVFASCDNVATWRLDDFSVGCDAHREATVKGSPWLASHPELPYAKALRAMLAKKVTP